MPIAHVTAPDGLYVYKLQFSPIVALTAAAQ